MKLRNIVRNSASLTLVAALAATASADSYLLIHTVTATQAQEVQQGLLGTGILEGTIDVVSAGGSTPSVSQMRAYDAVFVFSNSGFLNQHLLGDNLASYVDAGGGVVVGGFAHNLGGSAALQGRFRTQNYAAFLHGDSRFFQTRFLGAVHAPDHPVMEGVSSFHGGGGSYHNMVSVAPGAQLVASYQNGTPFIAARSLGAKGVVALNFYPPSSRSHGDNWVASTDGHKIMANALLFASGNANTAPVATPDTFTVEGGGTFSQSAPGLVANDTDEDGDALAAQAATLPEHGTLDLAPDGSFVYTPNAGFTGQDSFTYQASDGTLVSAPVTVTIDVVDTVAPTLSGLSADMVALATTSAGTEVSFDAPTAWDAVDGSVSVTGSHASGGPFAPGLTTVTFTATDLAGNQSSASFTVWVQFDATSVGAGGSAKGVKAGATVHLRFNLTGQSASIVDAFATFRFRGPDGVLRAGGSFSYDLDNALYAAKWRTTGLAPGQYEVLLDLNDGVARSTTVTLR